MTEKIKIDDIVNVLPWHKELKWQERREEDINKIIVHQSLSNAGVEEINEYHISVGNHINQNGCPHICYHYAIDKDGTIYKCNEIDKITWHTKGQNTNSLSIVVLGNFIGTGYNKGSEPTEEQKVELVNLIECLILNISISNKNIYNNYHFSKQNVYGHYHFGKPACPGKTLSEIIEKIRGNSFNRLDDIKDIQDALSLLGYHITVDGIMGIETRKIITMFQINKNIPISGYADERTIDEILKSLSERGT